MLKSSLCNYSDAYILVSGTITIDREGYDDPSKQTDERNKKIIFKNCSPFTDCTSEINNTQIDNRDLNAIMPMYNLIEYSNDYSETAGSLWQYYKADPYDDLSYSKSFNFKAKIMEKTPTNDSKKDVKIVVPLKYLCNFWRTHEVPLINCEINLISIWSTDYVISSATGKTKFVIADTKLFVQVVTLSTQDNAKLLEQLKSGFKRTNN